MSDGPVQWSGGDMTSDGGQKEVQRLHDNNQNYAAQEERTGTGSSSSGLQLDLFRDLWVKHGFT